MKILFELKKIQFVFWGFWNLLYFFISWIFSFLFAIIFSWKYAEITKSHERFCWPQKFRNRHFRRKLNSFYFFCLKAKDEKKKNHWKISLWFKRIKKWNFRHLSYSQVDEKVSVRIFNKIFTIQSILSFHILAYYTVNKV